jgi:hypothetical protein
MAAVTIDQTQFITTSSDTEFRAWAQGSHDAFIAAGLVAVTATGEINLATVTKPASTGGGAGFKVYKLAGHDSVADIIIRIDYGIGGHVNAPGWWFNAGYGHNGSGGFTGNSSGQQQLNNGAGSAFVPSAGQTNKGYYSGDGLDRLSVAMQYELSGSGQNRMAMLHIERLKDAAGVPNNLGFYVFSYGKGNPTNGYSKVVPVGSSPVAASNALGGHPSFAPAGSNGGGQSTFGNDVATVPHTPMLGRLYCSSLLLYKPGDLVGVPVDFTVDHFGTGKAYKGLGVAGPTDSQVCAYTAGSNVAHVAIPYY